MTRWRPSAGRLGMRSVVLLGMVLPVLGVSGMATIRVVDRLDQRAVSEDLRTASEELRAAIGFRAAVAEEEIHSTVLGLARDFELGPTQLADVADGHVGQVLTRSREQVDGQRSRWSSPAVDRGFDHLDRLRTRLDAGVAGRGEVAKIFSTLNDALGATWSSHMAAIERIADREPLDGGLRARLRTLRQSVMAFEHGGPRINAALQLLLDQPTRAALVQLLRADARFDSATEQASPEPGTAAAAAWRALVADPAAQRTEALIDRAASVALDGDAPWAEPDPRLLLAGMGDGERWGALLVAVPEAAAADLSAVARAAAESDVSAVRSETAAAAVLALASVAIALAIARAIARPTSDLEVAARRVEGGDFDLPPVPTRGPREVRATVTAFNDMAATLAAVEDHAVALAEEPTSPVLDRALPGRTGHAMQGAIDRLRRSVDQAEAHRAELVQLATHDGLTGLLNRAAAYAEIDRELARAARERDSLLAIYVDLDGLKELNDAHGHETGDMAIVRTASALRATTRSADVVARLGGDEFLVVGPVPIGGPAGAIAFAERIHAAVAGQAIPVDGAQQPLRCSVGVALSSPAGETTEELVRAADSAMYRAKAAGRDRVVTSGFA